MNKKQKLISVLAENRTIIQIVLGLAIYLGMNYYEISIWWVVAFGSAIGIIWGKVFCRWMCPMGIMMEFMMKLSPNDSFKNMYQYHKIGCPIAWISGLLNKVSFYKIRFTPESCKNCGLCDKACYMPSLDNKKFSLYKPNMENPAENYSCSKCLQCVAECPNGSLTYKIGLPSIKS
ncbi:MAG: 4Fe-4S binding protein [Bacteroidales bacterium]|nr:4Fe-4S binding protein [Bacteroidales bacterium]